MEGGSVSDFPSRLRKALWGIGGYPTRMVEAGDEGSISQSAGPTRRDRRLHPVLLPLLIVAFVVVLTALLFGSVGLDSAKEGAVTASVIIPGAIGLSLIYGIRKFANFAHGELMTLGGYTAFFVNVQLGLSLFWGFLLAPVVLAGVGILLELLIFSRLERKGFVAPLVASIGLSLFLQNLVSIVWGTNITTYAVPLVASIPLPGGISINPIKGILTLVLGVGFVIAVHGILRWTTLGKAMRAASDNMDLARTTGIRTRRVIIWAWIISAALAGVAGILIGLARDVRPTMGFDLLLLVFSAVILGGIGSPYGAMLGGFVIGLATNLSIPYLSWLDANWGLDHGTAYSPAVAFIIMVIVLLVRPEGILGVRREKGGTGAIRWFRTRLARAPAEPDQGGPTDGD